MFENEFPEQFEVHEYRSANPDLSELADAELSNHYQKFGVSEGRVSNRLMDRDSFSQLASQQSSIMEIGPFASPLLRGSNVKYADVLSTEELRLKAESIGISTALIPNIDFTISGEMIETDESFGAIISSHVIEHSPNLIGHLQQVEDLLDIRGIYFLLIPDHRYCFDHYQTCSSLSEVLEAHVERRVKKSFRSVFLETFNTTHNDSLRHWSDDHGQVRNLEAKEFKNLCTSYQGNNPEEYYDVHSWFFTPNSFSKILKQLNEMGLSGLVLEHIYPTRRFANEFWLILRKS